MKQTKILLTGANGRTGRAILQALARRDMCVRAMIRDEAQGANLRNLGATEIAVGDFMDEPSLNLAMKDVDKVLHIGPPMHPGEVEISRRLIKLARQNHVRHFIYYSVMHPVRREVRHHRLKLDVEEAVIESGLTYTIVQPARYMQHLEKIWPRILQEGVHAMPFSTEQQFSVVDLKDLAEACAIIAGTDAHHFAIYELAGPQPLSQEDMAKIISMVLGKAVRAEQVSWDTLKKTAEAAGASEDRIEQMLIMNRHYDQHGFRGNPNILENIMGRPATRFEGYVQSLANEHGTRASGTGW